MEYTLHRARRVPTPPAGTFELFSTEVTDRAVRALPPGPIGRLAHGQLVRCRCASIFAYRRDGLDERLTG